MTVNLAKLVVGCGNCSGKKVGKFRKSGLTPVAASCIYAPLVDARNTNLECYIADAKMVDECNFFILEVVKA